MTPSIALAALATGVLSGTLTWLQVRLSGRLGLTDAPRIDRWHRRTTATSGGIAVLVASAAAYALLAPGKYPAIAAGAAFLALVGLIDDLLPLRPAVKLAAQAVAAAAVIADGTVFAATPWPWVNAGLSFLWLVGITNAFNLIDNMDGLCAGTVVVICGFRLWLLAAGGHAADALLCAIFGSAFAGFLVFNYSPARIFMGDCGSMLAGFTMAALAIASPLAHTKVFLAGVFYPALTFLYPIFDTVLVSVLRKLAGRPVSAGGRDHSSHRLAALGLGERRAVWVLWTLAAMGSAVGLMVHWVAPSVVVAAAVLLASVSVLGIFLATLPPYSVSLESLGDGSWMRRRVPTLRAGTIVAVDALLAGLALLAAYLARFEAGLDAVQMRNLLASLPVVISMHGAASALLRTYAVAWRWVSLADVLRLARPAVAGAAISFTLLWMLGAEYYSRSVVVLYPLLSVALSAALRISLRLLQDLAARRQSHGRRIAVFGADAQGEMLASLAERHLALNLQPVVFFDRDRDRDGLRIRGLPVRHCDADIAGLSSEYQLEAILALAGALSNGNADFARRCRAAGVRLMTLDISVKEMSAIEAA